MKKETEISIQESYCMTCGRYILKDLNASKPKWVHTPIYEEAQPTDHEPEPKAIFHYYKIDKS